MPVRRSPSSETSAIGALAGRPPSSSPRAEASWSSVSGSSRWPMPTGAVTAATSRRCITASTRAVAAAVSASSTGPRSSDSA
jgi:hypothetical protein